MTNVQTGLLYFSVVVSALYLVAGGYKTIRAYFQKKFDYAVAAKASETAEK